MHELKGNILFLSECDEEDNSNGMMTAVRDLNRIAKEWDLDYVAAINTDYTAPLYPGDPHRYIYCGSVGKLLPSFFIVGRETHAGQVFEGLDPNLVAAELTSRIDYNPDFCDRMYGEVTQPPVSLKQTDLKRKYDVQTPLSAFVYYNFFVYRWSPQEVLDRLKTVAMESLKAAYEKRGKRFQQFCLLNGDDKIPRMDLPQPQVYTYEELYQECKKEYGTAWVERMDLFRKQLQQEDLDLREYCCRMVEELWSWKKEKTPGVILFFSSSYFPRICLDEKNERDHRLMRAVRKAVQEVQPQCSHPIEIRHFFPYISDMSFLAIHDKPEEIQALQKNLPGWGTKYQMDLAGIRSLQIPVVNIGPYGMDAHKQWERVEIPYSMNIVPKINQLVIRFLLE